MIIYKATNELNDKCYIGQTIKSLKHRKQRHIYRMNGGDNNYFHNALSKYGKDNFEWEVLCECSSKEEMDEMEFHYIKQYDSFAPNGYNLTMGGDKGTLGWIPSKETRKRMSEAKKDFIPWNKGKTNCYSDETKRKMSVSQKKRKVKSSKLKEDDIREVLHLFFIEKINIDGVGKVTRNGKKMSYKRALALRIHENYNVTTKCIEYIIDGETWKNVYKEYKI